jgi:hypothetical protein
VRTESGKQFVQRIPVQIPEDAALGQLLVFVGDGGALQEGSPAKSFVPQDLSQLVRAINTVKKSDRTVLSPVYEMELPPAEFVISGQQLIAIDVVR